MMGLAFEGVFACLGGRSVLDDVSLVARRGELTALVGPNGAGKSTCLRVALGLVEVTEGRMVLDGVDLAALPPRERARRLAYVPQRSRLNAAIPVRRVVAQGRFAYGQTFGWPTREDRVAVDRALSATRLEAFAERLFTELSSGEQQRVLLARALATGATTVLLDEPTSALDVGHALSLLERLRELAAAGCCVVAVLHDLNQARRWADEAILMDRGEVVAQGPVADIVARGPVRRVYGVRAVEGGGLGFEPSEDAG